MLFSHRKIAVTVAVAAAAGSVLTGCGSSSSKAGGTASDCTPVHKGIKTVTSGSLTVGVIDIPPLSSYNSGDPKGVDVSIVKKIAKEECLKPVWQQATYADAIQSISGSRIDMAIGSIDATAKRGAAVDFSASTYLDGMGIAAKTDVSTIDQLAKVGNVGTVDGYLWVNDLKKILGSKLKTYPSSVELKADLDAGRIQASVDAYPVLVTEYPKGSAFKIELANKHPDPRVQAIVKAPEAAFPLTKGNTSLKTATSEDIVKMRKDGTLAGFLKDAGLDPKLADVGATQYIVPAS